MKILDRLTFVKYRDGDPLFIRQNNANSKMFKEPKSKIGQFIYFFIFFSVLFIPLTTYMKYLNLPMKQGIIGVLISPVLITFFNMSSILFFKEHIYILYNIQLLFITPYSTEDIPKSRFLLMNIFPIIIFGFIPYICFLFNHNLSIIGTISMTVISASGFNFLNIFNAIFLPNDAIIYNNGINSYWYTK